MLSLTTFAGADYSDYTPAEAPIVEEPNVDVPTVEEPEVDVPEVEVPSTENPSAEVPELDFNEGEEAVIEEEYEYEEYEEEYIDIMPLSRPVGIPATTHPNVNTETALRNAITATTAVTVIRITDNIEVTGGIMSMGGTAARRVYIYSYPETFTVTRTSGTDRIMRSRGVTNIYNVHFTTNINPRTATANRGGLEVDRGTLNLHEGFVVSNSRQLRGGGILVDGATLVMHGGLVYNNVSSDTDTSTTSRAGGGGIAVGTGTAAGGRGTLTMHGGTVQNNLANIRGGGIRVTNGTATLHAAAVVDNNISNGTGAGGGGGIFVQQGGNSLTVNNATISNNTTAGSGGGISLGYSQFPAGAATLNVNGITLSGNRANAFGGGLHGNTAANIDMEGVIIIDDNHANYGGGMRFFSGTATTIDLTPGSRVTNNTARANGAGLSIVAANNIGIHLDGVLFENNFAIGEGGAIRHEGTNIYETAARGIRITNSTFRNNRALNGGAISLIMSNPANRNLPITTHSSNLTIRNTIFEGNRATAGLLIDENLAARNHGHANFACTHAAGGTVEGSVEWFGPRTNAAGVVQAVEMRNHIWNNYDVVTRNRIEGRNIYFGAIGTAASASTTMSSQLIQTSHSTNPTAPAPGLATTGTTTAGLPQFRLSGDGVIRNSIVNVELHYVPWNANIIGWYYTRIEREWYGDPVGGHMTEDATTVRLPHATQPNAVISNNMMEVTNVVVNQHTRIEPRVDFRYHDITFIASPSTANTGGTVNGAAYVVRNLRESSATEYSAYTPGGLPIRENNIPTPAARDGWGFIGWTGPGLAGLDTTGMTLAQRIAAQEAVIAAAYVSGPMTFTANFEQREAHSIRLEPASMTLGNLQYGNFTATVLDQFGDPMPNQNSFVINWTSNTPANVTVSPVSPAGQPNTTTATATLTAPEGSNTIRATLGSTNIYAEGTVNVTFRAIAHSIRVTPTPNNIFRGESVELTATVLDQFGDPMPNQNSFAITWTSGTPANVGISSATSPADQANTTTATAATAVAALGSNNTVTATLTGNNAVSGTAAVNVRTEYPLTIANRPDNIGPHVNQTQSQDFVRPGTPLNLNQGTAPAGWTFLGWTTDIDAFVAAIAAWTGPNPATWEDLQPAVVPVPGTMPSNALTAFAIWGNQYGVPFVPNYYDITVKVVNSQNNLVNWSTLAIAPTGAQITPNNDGTFTLRASLNNVGHQLTASALGFQNSAPRAITQNDVLVTREITINLGAAANIDIDVRVERYSTANQLITTSTLAYNSTNVPGPGTGIFTVTVTGYSVGRNLTAAAPGFTPVNRGITIADLRAAPGPIVITLGGPGGYEYVNIPVRIEAESNNALIPHSVLAPAARVLTVNGDGTFVARISGEHVNSNLIGSAIGFNSENHQICYTDLARTAANPIVIPLEYATATPLSVRVERYVAGGTNEPLSTATLTRNGDPVIPNVGGTFTFNANGSNIDDILVASHYGFAPVTRTILYTDLNAPRLIVIVLGADGGYEPRDITVRVVDPSGNLIPHAALTLTREASSVTVTPGTGADAGIFAMTVDGRNIGYSFTASAAGFTTRTDRILLYTDLHNGTLTIILQHADPTALQVRVERYVAGGTNQPLTTAALTRNGIPVTPNVGGTFTFNANGSNIGNVLVASHYGFADVQRTILYSDLYAPRLIVIVLGGPGNEYEDREITVRVEDTSGRLIPHATLALPGVAVTPGTGANAGIFTMIVTGEDIDSAFTASALGFTTRTDRVLHYTDLHYGTLTIVLQYATPTALQVRVERYVAGGTNEPLTTAALTRNGVSVTPNVGGYFTFNANGSNIGNILVASHYGFADVTRTILYSDLEDPRLIVIVLGDDGGYVPRDITVRVEDVTGNLIPHAALTLTREASSVTVTPGTGVNAGIFTMTVDGRNIGYNFTASALGFTTRTDRFLLYTDLHNGTLTIVLQFADAEPLNVRVERYVAGGTNEPLSTATLTLNNNPITPNVGGYFTFGANATHINQTLVASHYGFADVSHVITSGDLNAPRLIVIVLGADGGYEPREITVRVEDTSGNLIPHAALTLTREASSVTVTPGTGANAGIFTMTVDGRNIGYNFTASATGFTTRTDRTLLYTDLHNGTLTIVLQYAPATALTIHVYSSNGNRLPTARLTHEGTNVPRSGTTGNYYFTIQANGSNIGDVLVASAYGFANTSRAILHTDLEAPRLIVIILGDEERDPDDPYDPGDCDEYDPRTFTVQVKEETTTGYLLISTANLVVQTGQVNPATTIVADVPAGTFRVTADGRNVGDVLRASADGFSDGDHTIRYVDLAGGTVVIVLTRGGSNLILANVPSNLTHTGQTVTIGGNTLPATPPAIPGTHGVVFDTPVSLVAGGIAQNHSFLGWYRVTNRMPQSGDNINDTTLFNQSNLIRAVGERPNPYTTPRNFNMPSSDVHYVALWGARGIIGEYEARITFHAYGVGNFGRDAENNPITTIVIPVHFGQNVNLGVIEEYLASEEDAFAFWGWFTHEGLRSGIPRADLDEYGRRASQSDGVLRRRPAVGTFGFEGGFGPTITAAGFTRALSFTADQWNAISDNTSNLELHAIWSLWGDVNDDDRVNSDDLRELTWHVGQLSPRPTLNLAAADVHRNGVVNSDDLRELTWYVGQLFPRPVLGRRATPPPAPIAPVDNTAEEDTAIYDIPEYAYDTYEYVAEEYAYEELYVGVDVAIGNRGAPEEALLTNESTDSGYIPEEDTTVYDIPEYAYDDTDDYVDEDDSYVEFYVFYTGIDGIMDEVLDGTGLSDGLLTNETTEVTEAAETIIEEAAAAAATNQKLPQTGVEGTMLLWASLMTLALMLALGAVAEIKKRKDSDDA